MMGNNNNRLKLVRSIKSLTMGEAADMIGVTIKTYRKYESGIGDIPFDKYVLYLKALGAEVSVHIKIKITDGSLPLEVMDEIS